MKIELWVFLILIVCSAIGLCWLLSLLFIFVTEIFTRLRAKRLQERLKKHELENSVKQLQVDYLYLERKVHELEVLIDIRTKGKKKK